MEDEGLRAVTKTFSVTEKHIARVRELAWMLSMKERRNVSMGEVVRKAIDDLYEKVEAQTQTVEAI